MTRILIVEDEQHLADGLRFNLEAECYDTEVVETDRPFVSTVRHFFKNRNLLGRGAR